MRGENLFFSIIKKVCLFLLVFIFISVVFQVITRYVFSFSVPWIEELARFLYVYLVFLGSILAFKEKTHIRADLLYKCLANKPLAYLKIFNAIIVSIFLLFLLLSSWRMADVTNKVLAPSIPYFRMCYIFWVIGFAAFVMLLNSLFDLKEAIFSLRKNQINKNLNNKTL